MKRKKDNDKIKKSVQTSSACGLFKTPLVLKLCCVRLIKLFLYNCTSHVSVLNCFTLISLKDNA